MALIGIRRTLIRPIRLGPALSYQAYATESSGGTAITYSSVNFGLAASNRVIAVIATTRTAAQNTVASVTIGGISATHATGTAATSAGVVSMSTDIWYASVPTGVTGTVVVNWNGPTTASAIQVYSILTSTPAPTSGDQSVIVSTTVTNTITVPANGFGICGVGIQAAGTMTFTNAVTDNNGTITGGRGLSVGHTTGTGSTLITGTNSGSTTLAMSSAAWGP